MSPSSLAFSRPIDAHKVAALIEILIEAAVEGAFYSFTDPAR